MTNEEALKIIGNFLPDEKLDNTKKLDALMKGMEALEKQISKKPTKNRLDYYCSACDKDQHRQVVGHIKSNGETVQNNYCSYCGHRLDWSKE